MSEITLARDGLDAAKEEPSQSSEDLLLEAFSPIGENDISDPVLATPTRALLPAAEVIRPTGCFRRSSRRALCASGGDSTITRDSVRSWVCFPCERR